jgi:hypothetical protein
MRVNVRTIVISAAATAIALAMATAAFAQDGATTTTPAPQAEPAVASPTDPTAAEAAAPEVSAPSETAAPPSDTTSSITGAPPAGKGLVVFYRPSRFAGGAVTFTAREGETEIGRLASGRYFALAADPGIHEYNIRGGETARVEVEEGETTYLQLNIAMGLMSGRGVLAPADRAGFEDKPLELYTPS